MFGEIAAAAAHLDVHACVTQNQHVAPCVRYLVPLLAASCYRILIIKQAIPKQILSKVRCSAGSTSLEFADSYSFLLW